MLSKLLSEAIGDEVPWDLHEAYGVGPAYVSRRREPKYTGLLGARHEAAVKKGYIDLGLVDPARAKELGVEKMITVIARGVVHVFLGAEVAFIRDPEGIISNNRIDPKRIGVEVISDLAAEIGEEGGYASERDDQQAAIAYSKGEHALRRASITFMPVKGKTGSGYKVIMNPSFVSIRDRIAGASM